jgi:hypothetical protein
MKIVIDVQGLDTLSLSMDQARELYNDLKAVFEKEIKPPYIDFDDFIGRQKRQPDIARPYGVMAYAVQPPNYSNASGPITDGFIVPR